MKELYKETKNFILISLSVLIIGTFLIFELINYVDINNNDSKRSVNVIYEID